MADASILVPPKDQWFGSDGTPLAGGLIRTYVPGTTTPKTTWLDPDKASPGTNPIVLDANGRQTIYGDGAYRFVVTDALGNAVYDALTAAYLPLSDVSAFMAVLLAAPDSATFLNLSGTTAQLQAALNALMLLAGPTGPTGPQGIQGVTGPTGPSGEAVTPVYFFTGGPPSQGYWRFGPPGSPMWAFGTNVTDGSGNCTVTFSAPFVNAIGTFGATPSTGDPAWFATINNANNVSMLVATGSPKHSPGWPGPLGFSWWAFGS